MGERRPEIEKVRKWRARLLRAAQRTAQAREGETDSVVVARLERAVSRNGKRLAEALANYLHHPADDPDAPEPSSNGAA